jgi:hypothetical protein
MCKIEPQEESCDTYSNEGSGFDRSGAKLGGLSKNLLRFEIC